MVSVAYYDRIRNYLMKAQNEGAVFQLGSVPPELSEDYRSGYWVTPTILSNVDPSSILYEDEISGPVVIVTPFRTEAEVVRLANSGKSGLGAVVLTQDVTRTLRLTERLEVGMVWVNCWGTREMGMPFGGLKGSGLWRQGGDYSRDFFTDVKTVHLSVR